MTSYGIAFPSQNNTSQKGNNNSPIIEISKFAGDATEGSIVGKSKFARETTVKSIVGKSRTDDNNIESHWKMPIRCPYKSEIIPDENICVNQKPQLYRIGVNRILSDPTIVNTPPTDFIKQLKSRMNVYFTESSDSNQ